MRSSQSFTFTGDHNAVEEWAARVVTDTTGREPDRAVFSGAGQTIWISPTRLRDLGLLCIYRHAIAVNPGESVTWTGTTFVASWHPDEVATPTVTYPDELHALRAMRRRAEEMLTQASTNPRASVERVAARYVLTGER